MDAKQRAILAVPVTHTTTNRESDQIETKIERRSIVCAEPSPDALSALAAAVSGSGLFGASKETELALAIATQEQSGQLVRNATVQLLRDGLYRQCEAFMNGLVDHKEYGEISEKYVVAMVTLLAVEQLTSSARPTPIVLTPGAVSATTSAGSDLNLPADTQIQLTKGTVIILSDKASLTVDGESTSSTLTEPTNATLLADTPAKTSSPTPADLPAGTQLTLIEETKMKLTKGTKLLKAGEEAKTLDQDKEAMVTKETKVALMSRLSAERISVVAKAQTAPGSGNYPALAVADRSDGVATAVDNIVRVYLRNDYLQRLLYFCQEVSERNPIFHAECKKLVSVEAVDTIKAIGEPLK
ncbi:MAG: hypothetical protein ACREVE_17370 [Gammaproteobacteria bacterium]